MSEFRNEFNSASKDAKWVGWKIFGWSVAIIVILSIIGYAFGWFGEAAQVAHDEYGPKAALKKYEWFKDQANRIKKVKTDIATFEKNLKAVDGQYASYGADKSKWTINIQTQYNNDKKNARTDLVAITSNYNNLVRDYNSQSSKFNWTSFKADKDTPQEKLDEYVIPAGL